MQAVHRRKRLVFVLSLCFLVVIGAEASSGHIAIALVVTGLGVFVAALRGSQFSKARPLLFTLSLALNIAAIGLMINGKAV